MTATVLGHQGCSFALDLMRLPTVTRPISSANCTSCVEMPLVLPYPPFADENLQCIAGTGDAGQASRSVGGVPVMNP